VSVKNLNVNIIEMIRIKNEKLGAGRAFGEVRNRAETAGQMIL